MLKTQSMRSLSLVGHAGAIKTQGSVDKGHPACDFDPQEKAAGDLLGDEMGLRSDHTREPVAPRWGKPG